MIWVSVQCCLWNKQLLYLGFVLFFFCLGSGNGMMLIELAREGFTKLTGVDYSPKAIKLSENIAKDQDVDIEYKVADILHDGFSSDLGLFNVVHDKGFFIWNFNSKMKEIIKKYMLFQVLMMPSVYTRTIQKKNETLILKIFIKYWRMMVC